MNLFLTSDYTGSTSVKKNDAQNLNTRHYNLKIWKMS